MRPRVACTGRPGLGWLALLLAIILGTPATSTAAERIISLAPHLTELVFAIGAGDRLVGVSAHSDYPPAAADLPQVGDAHQVDIERLLRLEPDLVLAWAGGTPRAILDRLEAVGLPVQRLPGSRFQDVPHLARLLGELTDRPAAGESVARAFEDEWARIRAEYADRPRLRGFYELWPQPLMTVSRQHFIGQAMEYCGIENIVPKTARGPTPTWSEEAVLRARPAVLVASPPARDFERWRRWSSLPAVQLDGLIVMPPDLLVRIGPRLIEALEVLCAAVDTVRQRQAEAAR
ncbi:MAG: cobalamin-binding protein [Halothiobacillaceae bacterium]